MKKRAIVWFRQDLRLHDNEAIAEAMKRTQEIVFVFVFDERIFNGKTQYFGFPKTGKFRTKFIIEAIEDLRKSIRYKGAELIVRVGKPEEEIAKIADETSASWVFCNRERTSEEVVIQDNLEKKLWSLGKEIIYTRGKMLYYTQDLPFPVTFTPDTFTQFRKEVEKIISIRKPIEIPSNFKALEVKVCSGEIPKLQDFGHEDFEQDKRAVFPFKGGEKEALRRLTFYLWESDFIKNYKQTRNELLGVDYSSKFSPYLAQGCLSPKLIYNEIRKYEEEKGGNESTYWLFFELLWRDFFRLMGKKYENKIFLKDGPRGKADTQWKNDKRLFKIWAEGNTGIPFIDANMKELNTTGFMSNRGRQNVASFLVKDLMVNWQMGAEYFESILLDYDPCSNYGNWNYVAGIGADPRENRYFNILRQAKMYDPKGAFVKTWLPVLTNLPDDKVHQPEQLSVAEQEKFCLKIGLNYPKAMINTQKWEKG